MKLVAGLGNPGDRYDRTRHNVGFMVVDELARRWKISVDKYKRDFEAQIGDGPIAGQRTLLIKPQTFMNLSGRSVKAVQRFYKLALSDVLVVCDDLDLPPGQLRLRGSGSGGGQKGLENVLLHLASNDIARLRIGIGKVHSSATTEHVLSRFTPDQHELMAETLATAADAVECWVSRGVDTAMNRFNRKPEKKPRGESETPPDDRSEGESS